LAKSYQLSAVSYQPDDFPRQDFDRAEFSCNNRESEAGDRSWNILTPAGVSLPGEARAEAAIVQVC